MHEFIETSDDILALTVSGKITGDDLDAMIEQLEQAFDRHEKVHVFVETRSLDAIELRGLASYLGRALPMFGKLHRFGRVAVVADQTWVQVATRIESAVLPGIGYRTFAPSERDEALAWVMNGG
jgi:hypothetical protein